MFDMWSFQNKTKPVPILIRTSGISQPSRIGYPNQDSMITIYGTNALLLLEVLVASRERKAADKKDLRVYILSSSGCSRLRRCFQ